MRWLGLLGHYGLMGVYALVLGTLAGSVIGLVVITALT